MTRQRAVSGNFCDVTSVRAQAARRGWGAVKWWWRWWRRRGGGPGGRTASALLLGQRANEIERNKVDIATAPMGRWR